MSAKLQIKRGTTAAWNSSDASIDNTLAPGQLGVEYLTDNKMRLKVGKQTTDGSATKWSDLPYVTPPTSVYTDVGIDTEQLNSFWIGDSNQRISFNPNLHKLEIGAKNVDSTEDAVIGLYSVNTTTSATSAVEIMPGYISLGSANILVMNGANLGNNEHTLNNIYAKNIFSSKGITLSTPASYSVIIEGQLSVKNVLADTSNTYTLGTSYNFFKGVYANEATIGSLEGSMKISYNSDTEALEFTSVQ